MIRLFSGAAVLVVAFVICGGLGTLAGVLAALPFHGLARTVVWAVVGTAVAAGTGYLLDRLTTRKDVRQ